MLDLYTAGTKSSVYTAQYGGVNALSVQIWYNATDFASPTTTTTVNSNSNATSNVTATAKSSGLSTGAKAGIGVGVAFGVLALLLLLGAIILRKRHRRMPSPKTTRDRQNAIRDRHKTRTRRDPLRDDRTEVQRCLSNGRNHRTRRFSTATQS